MTQKHPVLLEMARLVGCMSYVIVYTAAATLAILFLYAKGLENILAISLSWHANALVMLFIAFFYYQVIRSKKAYKDAISSIIHFIAVRIGIPFLTFKGLESILAISLPWYVDAPIILFVAIGLELGLMSILFMATSVKGDVKNIRRRHKSIVLADQKDDSESPQSKAYEAFIDKTEKAGICNIGDVYFLN